MPKSHQRLKSSCRTSRKRRRAAQQQERWAKRRRLKLKQSEHNGTIRMMSHVDDAFANERNRMGEERIQDVSIRTSHSFFFPTIDVRWWLGHGEGSLFTKLPSSLIGACSWCLQTIHQSVEVARDTVFPSRVYQRQLLATQEQLSILMKEVEQLKQQNNSVPDSSSVAELSSSQCCQCNHFKMSTQNTATGTDKEVSTSDVGSADPVQLAPSAPSPPPPPPPPPPPLISAPKKLKIVPRKKNSADKAKSDKSVGRITLQDIQNVKLRKISAPKNQVAKPISGGPLVSLSDLKRVKLKKSNPDENIHPKMVLRNRISQEAMQFRGQLKKVHVARSPGGTPVRNHIRDDGTGLTPVMARALKRKFQGLRTPSPGSSQTTPPLRN